MTTFSYTTGNPSNLTAGATASMNDIQGPLTDLRTFLNGGTIDSTNIAAGPTRIATPQAWQTISLTGFSPGTLSFMKDSLGFVRFRGDVVTTTGAAPGAGATIGTLPAGYRPGVTIVVPANPGSSNTIPKPIQITTAGVMTTIQVLSNSVDHTFSGVSFLAEN